MVDYPDFTPMPSHEDDIELLLPVLPPSVPPCILAYLRATISYVVNSREGQVQEELAQLRTSQDALVADNRRLQVVIGRSKYHWFKKQTHLLDHTI